MFEKEVTRYYCLRCKRVSKHLRIDKCPYCRGDCEEVKLERSGWGRIGKPAAIIFGIAFWLSLWLYGMVTAYVLGAEQNPPPPLNAGITAGLLLLAPSFFGALFFFMVFLVKDENIIAARISEMKGVTPPVDTITLHRWVKKGEKVCNNCMRPVPASTKKCPYCGYDYL